MQISKGEKKFVMEGSVSRKQELVSILKDMKNAENEIDAVDIGRRFEKDGYSSQDVLKIAKEMYPDELGDVVLDSTVSLMDVMDEIAFTFHNDEEEEDEDEYEAAEEMIIKEMEEEVKCCGSAYEEDDIEVEHALKREEKKRKVGEQQESKLTDDQIRKHIRALAPVVRRVTSTDCKAHLLELLAIQKEDVLDVERMQPLLHALFPVYGTWPEYYQQEFLILYNLDGLG
jgi:hypothetical protein